MLNKHRLTRLKGLKWLLARGLMSERSINWTSELPVNRVNIRHLRCRLFLNVLTRPRFTGDCYGEKVAINQTLFSCQLIAGWGYVVNK